MNDLSFDMEQLAAALERVEFSEDDVLQACWDTPANGSAQVGVFPFQGQTQFSLHPVLVLLEGKYYLHVVVFNNDVPPRDPNHMPEFTVELHTEAGDILVSSRDIWPDGGPLESIELADPASQLTGARLQLVT